MKVPTRPKGLLEPPVPLSQRWPAEIANPAAALGNQRAALLCRFDPGTCKSEQLSFLPDPPRTLLSAVSAAKRLSFRYKHKHIRGCPSTSTSYMPQTEGYTVDQTIQTPFTFGASDARWLFVYSPVKGITKQRIEVSALQCCFLKILMTSFTPGPNLIALFCFYGKYFIQFYFSKNNSKAHTCDDNKKS